MARHRGKARHPAVLIGGGVLAVAAFGAGSAYAAMNAADRTSPSAGASATSTTSSRSTSSSSAPSRSGSSPTTSSSSTSPSVSVTAAARETAAASALTKCVATVRAQDGLAKAVAASARDWGPHTDAQRKFDAGTYTVAQTKAQWAASKARGPADLTGFTSASTLATRTRGGCDGLAAATSGTTASTAAKRCTERATALAQVAKTGTVVSKQWGAHLAMMSHKEHMSAAAYLDRWDGMVEDSGPALSAYRAAAAALAKVPACAT